MTANPALLKLAQWVFVACGIWLLGLGGYFMFMRPPLLPEDLRYLGTSQTQIALLLPHLASWLRKVFIVLGGFMSACGALTLHVSLRAIARSYRGTGMVLTCVGLLTVATMSWINFELQSDFKWLLLAVALAWQLGLAAYFAAFLRR